MNTAHQSKERPPRWDRVKQLFMQAIELPRAERSAFLLHECAGDPVLLSEVTALLVSHVDEEADDQGQRPGGFMASPTLGHVSEGVGAGEGIGEQAGPYRLLEELGQGGFGTVYLAEQEHPVRRLVAVKIVKAGMDTRAVIARFEAERQALAMMTHPNIARVLDAGATASGRPFFAMELVRGQSITRYCAQNNLVLGDRLHLFIDVCAAVQHAHQRGIIHRDLKPDNILISTDDGVAVVKVIDFGIAKATAGVLTDKTLHTHAAQMMGTPAYMSPEQAGQSDLDIDTRSDIYSLGVVLYELLTGSPPHDPTALAKSTIADVQRIICEVEPERPSTRIRRLGSASAATGAVGDVGDPRAARGIKGDLDWIVMKCLEKQRTRRYDSAGDLVADIKRHLRREPVLAGPPGIRYRGTRFVQRHRGLVAAGAAVLVTALIGAGSALSGYRDARVQRDAAQKSAASAIAEAAKANAVRQFLEELFNATNPELSGGDKDITVAAALDQAQLRLNGGALKDDPALQGAVRLSLARTLRALGKLAQAQAQLEVAIPLLEVQSNPYSTDLLDALNVLVLLLHDQGRFDRAEEPARRALAQTLATRGEQHAAKPLESLAMTLVEVGKSEEALPLQTRAVAAYVAEFGEEDRRTGQALNNLAYLHVTNKQTALAIPLLERALVIQRREGPSTSLVTAIANTAFVLDESGRSEEAITRMSEALAMNVTLAGEDHPLSASLSGTLGAMCAAAGRVEEAIAHSERGLRIKRRVLAPESAKLADTILSHGSMLLKFGSPQQAEPLLREATALYERIPSAPQWRLADAAGVLADCLMALGRTDEAGPLIERASTVMAADATAPEGKRKAAMERMEKWMQRPKE